MSLGIIFLSEVVGTAMLILLGVGVVANVNMKTAGKGGGFLMVNWGWGLAVFSGVLVSYKSGGHLNPAVTLGIVFSQINNSSPCFIQGSGGCDVPISFGSVSVYIVAQLIGAFIGACLAYLAYKKQFDDPETPGSSKQVFATGPAIKATPWNLVTEAIGTFVLVFVVLAAGKFTGNNPTPAANIGWLGALGVGLLIVGIGASLGGPTGYAINPARDLMPRLVHQLMPIQGKVSSNWSYAWIPVVGPLVGGICAGLLSLVLLP
ncbi:MAG: aquaporin family protein [Propionibacteriaceae bacterium]|nr:aquaporin family protein [Propionibacteriaceae bacterium]